jgi:hypothetical protein
MRKWFAHLKKMTISGKTPHVRKNPFGTISGWKNAHVLCNEFESRESPIDFTGVNIEWVNWPQQRPTGMHPSSGILWQNSNEPRSVQIFKRQTRHL